MSRNYDICLIDMLWYELCEKGFIKVLTKLIGWIMHLYDEDVDWLIDSMVIWKGNDCIEKGVNWLLCIWDEL